MTGPERSPGLFGPIDPPTASEPSRWVLADEAHLVRVAFETGGDNLYDYALPPRLHDQLAPGQRIRAPFGKGGREQIGFCVDFPDRAEVAKVKPILEIVDPAPLLDAHMLELARWISQYYCCTLGAALSAMVPAAVKRQTGMVKRTYIQLTPAALSDAPPTRLSAKGRAILEHLTALEHHGREPVPLDDLAEQLQIGPGPFRTLARDGLLDISTRQELPPPTTAITPPPQKRPPFELSPDQTTVLSDMLQLLERQDFSTAVIHGVTGSGKTEIYIRAIERIIEQNGQALVLVPEISLTPQAMTRFLERFDRVAVLHSGLSNTQRNQQWRWIAEGGVDVVVGARSAVFAPLPRLKLIVVDEEHEPSYKQDTAPRYHGRNVALKRASMCGAHVILGSATPSLETTYNCQHRDHYHLLRLNRRVLDLPMPAVKIINMRDELRERKGTHLFSRTLETELRRCIGEGGQAILLLNRRGHSNYVFCPSCSFVLTCPNCDVSLTYHRKKRDFEAEKASWVMCHYCLHASRVPKHCAVCGKKLILIGPGTQKAEEELARKMPDIKVLRVDSDSVRPGQYPQLLDDFGAGKIDALLGTQMIGKGLDFPNVKLVGVLHADTALSLPDFRSSERTFQLIAQVAGRCGRADDTGRVIVQSYVPDDPAIALACQHDYDSFARLELTSRERCQMPPYYRLARIIMRDKKFDRLEQAGKQLRVGIDALLEQLGLTIEVRGPVPASIATLENYHRQEILLKALRAADIQRLLGELRRTHLPVLTVQTVVDVDPLYLL